jgi:hypothetical protein
MKKEVYISGELRRKLINKIRRRGKVRNLKRVLIAAGLVLTVAIVIVLSMVMHSYKKIDEYAMQYETFQEFRDAKTKEVIGSVIKNLKKNNDIAFSQSEIDNLLYIVVNESKESSSSLKNIKRVQSRVTDRFILVYADISVLGFMPSQIRLELEPFVVDDNVAFKVNSVKLGRININRDTVLEKIPQNNYILVNKKEAYFTPKGKLPEQIKIVGTQLSDEIFYIKTELSLEGLIDEAQEILDFFQ